MPYNKNKWHWDYELSKKFAKDNQLYTIDDWFAFCRHKDNRPKGVPSDPSRAFKNYNSKDFFERYTLESVKKFVKDNKITSIQQWHDCRNKLKPRNIPYDPFEMFNIKASDLWHIRRGGKKWKFMPYQEAKEIVQSLNIRSRKHFRQLLQQGKIPNEIPATPNTVYNGDWKNWGEFLNSSRFHSNILNFEQSKELLKNYNLTSQKEYVEFVRKNPHLKLSKSPESKFWRTKEWKGWGDYLSSDSMQKKWLGYEEAKEIVHKLGIRSRKHFELLHRQGKIPKLIPTNPQIVYGGKKYAS